MVVSVIAIAGVGFLLRSPSAEGVFAVYATPDMESATPAEPLSPEAVLRQYFAYIEGGQFDRMYNLLTDITRATISQEDFIERNRSIYEGISASNIVLTIGETSYIPERPERRTIAYTLRMDTIAGEITHTHHATMVRNANNEYRLQWNSRTIFPQLNENDRVRVRILPAERGNIYDRNGIMLAGAGTASAVGLVPGRMRGNEIPESAAHLDDEEILTYREIDINRVAELLDMTPEAVVRRLNASYVRDDVFVQLRIIPRDAQYLIDELLTIQGILINTAHLRYYPLGRRAAHLVGYVQNINAEELATRRYDGYHMNSLIGRTGIERIYEDTLRARDGREIFIIDEAGNRTATLATTHPVHGHYVRLTIDANIQEQLYDIFTGDRSASVAMNPITGEVLALVSSPAYDPNDFVRGMTTNTWNALNEDEDLPLFNRFRATFSPGSTMKALTAAIGVEGGYLSPTEDFGRGGRTGGRSWQRNETWGGFFVTTVATFDGPVNLNNAMAWSDNIYFAQATLRIGAETFAEGLQGMGFDERIPFEYGLSASSISRTGGFPSEILLADSGYGQGEVLMNPVHLAAIYGAFVNQGNIMQPHLIFGNTPQMWLPQAFSPETARVVLDSLAFSVEHGTGRNARIQGVNLAGKTGTAELKLTQDDDSGRELGWFVLLTADEDALNPLLVVSMVEDVQGRGGSGYVVPRVRQVFYGR